MLVLGSAPPTGAATDGITTPLAPASRRARTSFSFRPWMSADGRFVAFDSDAATLVAGDANRARDVFVHDRATGATSRVSVGPGGAEADGDSQRPTLSADGRYIAFWSAATNLVSGDTNDATDAFVHDRVDRITRRVSVGPDGVEAEGPSARPAISADGTVVAFESLASNLTPPGLLNQPTDTNGERDVFVHELASGKTTRVSVASDGSQGSGESVRPTISGDGRLIAFHSDATLVPDDTNEARDVYLYDRTTAATMRVSVASDGTEGDVGSFSPSMSGDGRYVAFWSNARTLVADDDNGAGDVFVRDRTTGQTERVSLGGTGEADADSADPSISPDGRYVAFWSSATNLVAGDTNGVRDVFLYDREAGTTVRVSVASDGTEGDADSFSPNVNAGGDVVVFDSEATTLVAGDTNRGSDIFVHTRDDAPTP